MDEKGVRRKEGGRRREGGGRKEGRGGSRYESFLHPRREGYKLCLQDS